MKAVLNRLKKFRPTSARGKRFTACVAFLSVAFLMSASIFATGPAATPQERTEKAWPVSVVEIHPAPLNPTFKAYGRVESSNVAHLRTDLNAEVEQVHVKEGDWVQRGQPLISLNDRELQLRLVEQRAQLAQLEAALRSINIEQGLVEESTTHFQSMQRVAQNKLSRHEDLIAERLISQSLLDEVMAQANLVNIEYQTHMRSLADFPNRLAAQLAAIARAEAMLAQAELDVEKTTITAPFDGPILGVFVARGDRSNIGSRLLEIADADGFEVRVQVPDSYGARLHASLSSAQRITATTAEGLRMPLARMSSQIRQGQSGLDAFFSLDPGSGAPLTALGRTVELSVTLPEQDNLVALPVQSIYANDRIYAVKDNRLEAITIERIGEMQTPDGQYRVLVRSAELRNGQSIITTQLPKAISGLLVEAA